MKNTITFSSRCVLSTLALVCAQLNFAYADAKPKYGPAQSPRAVTLAQSHSYLRSTQHAAPDYWSLVGYYVPQFNGYSCSVASVSMILNAARAPLPKTSDDKLLTQQSLLASVNVENWTARVSDEGYEGTHGVSLVRLAAVTQAAFRAHGFPAAVATAVPISDTSRATKAIVRRALVANERSANDYILANFNQQAYTDDADAGHIAPVAAYDAARGKVLVLDPDREWYEPYWVSLDTFVAGMATRDSTGEAFRGFVHVRLNR